MSLRVKDYTLTICEKPDAARRIARAIGIDDFREVTIDGVEVYVSKNGRKTYVVCPALGHLYTLEDPTGKRHIYPVLDVEWIPSSGEKEKERIARILDTISKLARNAVDFINSCDFDQEGEVIGYNILKYACNNKHDEAFRPKFSTLTEDELRSAFESMKKGTGNDLADAGRARHMLDFIYGINLSRALSESVYQSNKRFRNLTVGRVQGPTLSFVVDREIEIRTDLPTPFWVLTARFEKDDQAFNAQYEKKKIFKLAEANQVIIACKSKDANVSDINKTIVRQSPPTPFNLGDLQREAYRLFRFCPSFTLSVAERVYLDALISYPRTSSRKLPRSIDYKGIIRKLAGIRAYRSLASDLLKGKLVPNEGITDDPAHPAIYPTGEVPRHQLEGVKWKLYDLIVKRFFTTFGDAAVMERIAILIHLDGYNFRASGRRTIYEGWTKYYSSYAEIEEVELPTLKVGDALANREVKSAEKYTQASARFNQASLLDRMEKEKIGTKSTRAEIIKTLIDRGYITGESIEATDLGFAVVESMRSYMSNIMSTELTKNMEEQLEEVECGRLNSDSVVDNAAEKLIDALILFKSKEREVGKLMNDAIIRTVMVQKNVGACPLCGDGQLRIIKSKQSSKRFVGCSNFGKGCKGAMPLPQKGLVKTTKKVCGVCKWPIVHVRFMGRRFSWKLCINISCPTKKGKIKSSIH
ncbi:MAG: DNA topoisomerase I [Nitrososphaerales archaeon]